MSKYEKMIALNRENSQRKVESAKDAIWNMLEEGDKISIPKLMEKTGLSRGFFYKNPEVRRELDKAREQQAGMPDLRRGVMDLALNKEILLLQERVMDLEQKIERLKKENRQLQKALDRKNMNLLQNL